MHINHYFARFFLVLISLLCISSRMMADDEPDYFVYEDENKTTITGLTEAGLGQTELTIPASVTTVERRAFEHSQTLGISAVENLYIKGNPVFEIEDGESALTDVKGTLETIDMGSNMSLDNIKALLINGYGENTGTLEDIIIRDYLNTTTGVPHGPVIWGYIEDELGEYSIDNTSYGIDEDDPINNVLTEDVRVILPAEYVKNQIFGQAAVWGSFTLTAELSTFCGEANFYDFDDGSNWLFYVPTELLKQDKQIFFKRVKIITENEGVLIHNAHSTSQVVYLPRINMGDKYIEKNITDLDAYNKFEHKMDSIYDLNMLVGVIDPTPLQPRTNNYTNFILNNGMFYPTSGGTLKANRAYLQILTDDYNDMKNSQGTGQDVNLSFVFEIDNEDAIHDIRANQRKLNPNAWFTLDGRRLSTHPTLPGIYLNGGKKVIVGN